MTISPATDRWAERPGGGCTAVWTRCGPRWKHRAAGSSCAGARPTWYWRNWCARLAPRISSGTGSTIPTHCGATSGPRHAVPRPAWRRDPSTPGSSSSPGRSVRDRTPPIGCSRRSGDDASSKGSRRRATRRRGCPRRRRGPPAMSWTTGVCAAAPRTGQPVCGRRGSRAKRAHARGSTIFSPRVSGATTRIGTFAVPREPAGCRRICTSGRSGPDRSRRALSARVAAGTASAIE